MFSYFIEDIEIIQKLSDLPNDTDGLSPAQLKARFDEIGRLLKNYINDKHLPELEGKFLEVEGLITLLDNKIINNKQAIEGLQVIVDSIISEVNDRAKKEDVYNKTESDQRYPNKSDVLTKDNETPFTPTKEYQPAPKKYVDETLADAVLGFVPDGSISDAKLSNVPGQMKSRFNEHEQNYVEHIPYVTATGINVKQVGLGLLFLQEGLSFSFRNVTKNTGAATINVDSLGAVPLLRGDGTALRDGDLMPNSIYTVRYNGTAFILQGGTSIGLNMPLQGGTFTGIVKAHPNSNYTTAQLRNVILSPNDPVLSEMKNGDIWIKYKE